MSSRNHGLTDVICGIPKGNNLKYSTLKKCKKVYVCNWLKTPYKIKKLVFCQPNIEMGNGTISFGKFNNYSIDY